MSFKVHGINKLSKKIDKLIDNAKSIEGENHVKFDELFPPSFMCKYTSFKTIDEFEEKSNFDFKNMEDIPENELDHFVNSNTTFSSWKDMLTTASEIWVHNKLGI